MRETSPRAIQRGTKRQGAREARSGSCTAMPMERRIRSSSSGVGITIRRKRAPNVWSRTSTREYPSPQTAMSISSRRRPQGSGFSKL